MLQQKHKTEINGIPRIYVMLNAKSLCLFVYNTPRILCSTRLGMETGHGMNQEDVMWGETASPWKLSNRKRVRLQPMRF